MATSEPSLLPFDNVIRVSYLQTFSADDNSQAHLDPDSYVTQFAVEAQVLEWDDALRERPDTKEFPLPEPVIQGYVGPTIYYMAMWQSNVGIARYMEFPSRYFLQSSSDEWGFVSFASLACQSDDAKHLRKITERGRSLKDILLCSDFEALETCRLKLVVIPISWRSTPLPLLVVPLELLRLYVQQTSRVLAHLMKCIQDVELAVAAESGTSELHILVRKLHTSQSNLIKLERRWKFQEALATSIMSLLRTCKDMCNESPARHDFWKRLWAEPHLQKIDEEASLQRALSGALEYDLGVLPQRITNQFAALNSLIAQRDSKTTIDLASDSRKLAEVAMQDASSMKTIAAMTLIFLPGTFICSFFSMSFFDWRAEPADAIPRPLWVYFITAVPLTALVILIWIFCTQRYRTKIGAQVKRRGTLYTQVKREKQIEP